MTLRERNGKKHITIHVEGKPKVNHKMQNSPAEQKRKEAQDRIEDMKIERECMGDDLW
jgi:hypothetical protein